MYYKLLAVGYCIINFMFKKYKHEFYYLSVFIVLAILLELLGFIELDGEERFIGYTLIILCVFMWGALWRIYYGKDS